MRTHAILSLAMLLAGAAMVEGVNIERFITHRDGKLYDGVDEFRFVSWNVPNLHNIEDAFDFLGASPWRWPDEFEIRDALESVRQMGGTVVRTYVISVHRSDGDMSDNVHVLGPGRFNEEAFRTLDLVLKIAREKGIRVIVPLVDNWKWWGGVRQYELFRDKPSGAFWKDDQLFDDYRQTANYVINRRNSLTGVRYRDDPTILGWETGNELDSPPEWTRRASALLKELAPNHLIIDGRSLHGVPMESLEDPNVDIVTTHHYPNVGNNNAASIVDAVEKIADRKAYFVGEFGFLPVEEAQTVFDAVIEQGVSGALYWSLRFHRREGGFYWHQEPSGDDLFKAYHWPGFAAGHSYREHLVLPMVRSAAFRIRGLPVPAVPVPAPPRLLPIDPPGLLRWQGSAGADRYDVQRAETGDGPWQTIGAEVSDAAVQYRPLFADETAEPGVRYWYRVIAKNDSGDSSPSNTVGPIAAETRLMVDEMDGFVRLDSWHGPVDQRSGNARTTQEDIHRLALAPRSHVTYHTNEPIRSVRVWAFLKSDRQPVDLAFSANGEEFEEVVSRRRNASAGSNDYGYLRPTLLSAAGTKGAHYVKIAAPGDGDEVQLSRVEISYGGQHD